MCDLECSPCHQLELLTHKIGSKSSKEAIIEDPLILPSAGAGAGGGGGGIGQRAVSVM